jgi:hypothetical protein
MQTLPQHNVRKEFGKSKPVSSGQLYNLADPSEFLLQQKHTAPQKKVHKRLHIIKRTSPFLLPALLFPVAFLSFLLMHGTNNKILLCFLFTCVEINILSMDFALWNYYEGKKYCAYG